MTMIDDQLAASVTRLIETDPAVRFVNFQVKNLNLSTMGYFTVSALIKANRINCKVDPTQLLPGSNAVYIGGGVHTIIAKDPRFSFTDQKAEIIHESTHAFLDVLGGLGRPFSVRNLDNETAAYLAAAIFTTAVNIKPTNGVVMTINNSSKTVIDIAMDIVKGKVVGTDTNAGKPILFTDGDIAPLADKIKTMPLYKDWKTVTTMRGV